MINILLCSKNIHLIAEFYSALGIELVAEKHGKGPDHFSFKSDIECEIYPPRIPAEETTIFRIETDNLNEKISGLKEKFMYSGLIVSEIKPLSSGQKAIVRDPDGRTVELFERLP